MNRGKKALRLVPLLLLILFVLLSALSLLFIKLNFDHIFRRPETPEYGPYLRYGDVASEYERELLPFQSGRYRLQGYLYGAGNTRGLVVISHGLGGVAESYLSEALYFVDHGYQVFCFDNTGCGGSEGESSVGLSQSVLDLSAALDYLESEPRFGALPVLLYGHSWGGYAVTAVLQLGHPVAASVSVAGFDAPMTMMAEWMDEEIPGFVAPLSPYLYLYQLALFGGNANLTAVDGINSTETPVLLIHGAEDSTIRVDGAATFARQAEITNPNVQYKLCTAPTQSGHNSLFAALDAISYSREINALYQALLDECGGTIPPERERAFYAGVDRRRMSALDADFMAGVLAFYEAATHENQKEESR